MGEVKPQFCSCYQTLGSATHYSKRWVSRRITWRSRHWKDTAWDFQQQWSRLPRGEPGSFPKKTHNHLSIPQLQRTPVLENSQRSNGSYSQFNTCQTTLFKTALSPNPPYGPVIFSSRHSIGGRGGSISLSYLSLVSLTKGAFWERMCFSVSYLQRPAQSLVHDRRSKNVLNNEIMSPR